MKLKRCEKLVSVLSDHVVVVVDGGVNVPFL